MPAWHSIEKTVSKPIWVLKYTLYSHPVTNEYCDSTIPGAIARVSCHGWYEHEWEAKLVLDHFPKPNTYQIEKVWKRELKEYV